MGSRDTKSEHVDFFSTPIHARFVSPVCRVCFYDAIDKVHCNHPFSSFFVAIGFLDSLLWSIVPPIIVTRVLEYSHFCCHAWNVSGFRLMLSISMLTF